MSVSRRLILAALWHAAITIAIALIGGGWWALGRVDPLFAVPGLGWASAIMLWTAGPMSWRAAGLAGGATAIIVAAIAAIWGLGAFPWLQWAVFTLCCIGLAIIIAGWVWPYFERVAESAYYRRRSKLLFRIVATALCGFPFAAAAWAILPILYEAPTRANGPRVALLTSLPLTSGQGDVAAVLAGLGDEEPALTLLRQRFRLTLADSVDPVVLAHTDVLLLAHPRALAPQQLVTIDDWVRGGGTAMIFADGLSSWEPPYPIGDPRNPPLTSLLTPLLSHWGLTLDAPAGLVAREEAAVDGGQRLYLFSPGRFHVSGGECRLLAKATIADCRIGLGRAIIVADVDWLRARYWGGNGKAGVGTPANWRSGNMLWLMDRLDALAGKKFGRAWAEPVWTR